MPLQCASAELVDTQWRANNASKTMQDIGLLADIMAVVLFTFL